MTQPSNNPIAAPVEAVVAPAASAALNPIVSLPAWNDSQAVTTYIVSVVGAVFGILGAVHPGWTEPSWVTAVIPSVGILVAFAAQWVNVATHRSTNKAVALAVVNKTPEGVTPQVAISNPVRLTSQQKKELRLARQEQLLHAAAIANRP